MGLLVAPVDTDEQVKDIYGGDYEKFNLKGSVVAASFGKLASMPNPKDCAECDLALALLIMITQQIALIAFNIAKRHDMEGHIFFVGTPANAPTGCITSSLSLDSAPHDAENPQPIYI